MLIEREALKKRVKQSTMSHPIKAAMEVFINTAPTIDPIRAAGGCRCGECKKHMTPECLLCDFDVDGSCTGGPESNFYCGDSEPREAQDDG